MVRLPDGSELHALVLDLDDTILDNRSGVSAAWDHIARVLADGCGSLSAATARAHLDRVTDWFWSDPERHRSGRLDLLAARRTILGRVLAEAGHEDPALVEHAAVEYQRHRDSTQRLEEGALEVLEALRGLFPRMALLTNGASGPQRGKVERFGLERFFDHVQIEGEAGVGKPERDAYARALAHVEVEPRFALMAGDDFEADVLGALEAGLHAAWIDARGRGRPPARAPRAYHTLAHLRELLGLLQRAAAVDAADPTGGTGGAA
jgi:putative hydrolase of the HAD superfamily